tara:strand:- start:525 stop:749 length:225 start_codon:yes stop_codon:yes gene_type:complete
MNKYLKFKRKKIQKKRFGMAGGVLPGWSEDDEFGKIENKKAHDAALGMLLGAGFLIFLPFIIMSSDNANQREEV